MKRLLCIVGSLDAGGAETFMIKIFRNLPNEYKIDFVVSTENGFHEKEVKKLGGKIFRITRKTKNILLYCKDLMNVIKNGNYNYVMRIGANSLCTLDLWIAYICGVKVRVFRSSNAGGIEGYFINLLHFILKVPLTSIANVKISPSYLAARYTFGKRNAKKNVYYLKNAINYDMFAFNYDKRKKIRDEFGIEDSIFLIGHIGRFNIQKNHDFLIDVFFDFSKQYSNSKLVLIGKGELEKDIHEKIERLNIADKVIFTGTRSDIQDILSAIDLVVFPSFFEGMPNTIIEAQASGLNCLISDNITKEANITGLVTYLPLNNKNKWINEIQIKYKEFYKNHIRINTKKDFIDAGYDINEVINRFIELIFDDRK